MLRLNLYWNRVATTRPASAADPGDPAYDWSLYDRAVAPRGRAKHPTCSSPIIATPGWANGGKGAKYAPAKSATSKLRQSRGDPVLRATTCPCPVRLVGSSRRLARSTCGSPGTSRTRRTSSCRSSARSATATSSRARPSMRRSATPSVGGVHAPAKRPAFARRSPAGPRTPAASFAATANRDSVSPLLFLEKMKTAGAQFDVYAHHPYSPSRHIAPGRADRLRQDHHARGTSTCC